MSDDVVAELNAELALIEPLPYRVPIHHLARRARDEIVELRKALQAEMMGRPDKWHAFIAEARAEALEEAARVCEGGYTTGSTRSTLKAVAVAIRKLKEETADD